MPGGRLGRRRAPGGLEAPTWVRLWPLLTAEWRHHPWRHAAAVLAVALGVALAWSVHLINGSALSEFSAAVRSAQGEPDAVVRVAAGDFDDGWLDRLAVVPGVRQASPVVSFETYALPGASGQAPAAPLSKPQDGQLAAIADPDTRALGRVAVRVVAMDALAAAAIAPGALPQPSPAVRARQPLALLDPNLVFLNPAARDRLGLADGQTLALQAGPHWRHFEVGGSVAAAGPPLVVLDIAAAQAGFGLEGRLSRIDLRLAPGVAAADLAGALPPGLVLVPADEAAQRVSNLSRAYRVNLTVLALVALFVGAFLVYSVVALSVAQRAPSFALLGVLGLTAGERRALVLAECALLGLAGSAAGLALGAGLALAALRGLAGDLGGGYFPGIAPALRWDGLGLVVFGALGVASALVGGWVPARRAQSLQPAQALKGLGGGAATVPPTRAALALLALGAGLALLPPVAGLPLAAYASVAALLVGGVALVPGAVQVLLALPRPEGSVLALLAWQRARHQRHTATAAVAGVVASLALSVALTVMVTSFRQGVTDWLDRVLPADLYARTASSAGASAQAWLPQDVLARVQALPGVRRVEASRLRSVALTPGRPPVTLVARDLADPAAALPLVQAPSVPGGLAGSLRGADGPAGAVEPDDGHADLPEAWVSEAMVTLYGAAPGTVLRLPLDEGVLRLRVRGVWRDYARQFGAVAVDRGVYRRLTGDDRVNDLALWLAPAASMDSVQAALRAVAPEPGMLEFAATQDLRRLSLAIFDRSFAVTYYLQAVAIGIVLVGVAASLSAQVLARRKEFGLLSHLGLTRGQVVGVVAGETLAWLAAGALVGLGLGLAISVVLVHVVNPQSFHWTMELVLPWARLAALCAAVLLAGTATAAFSARRAASRAAVLSVKEDW